jgi:hypothetical protein
MTTLSICPVLAIVVIKVAGAIAVDASIVPIPLGYAS